MTDRPSQTRPSQTRPSQARPSQARHRARERKRRVRAVSSDDLGLRRALSDRLLPLLVGAMAFLAALALAGVLGASGLAEHWRQGAAAALTVQVPDPDLDGRLPRVLGLLQGTPGVQGARALDAQELDGLLRPWLGEGAGRIAIPLPAVVAVRLSAGPFDQAGLSTRLQGAAPGTLVEAQDQWVRRLSLLAGSLQACAALVMGVVGLVAIAVVVLATRSGLAGRREAIEIVHGLGATDGFVAGRFAGRATRLAAFGAATGALAAAPVLVGVAGLVAPFGGGERAGSFGGLLASVPSALWLGLPLLPVLAAGIGWVTTQVTVRRWLRRLP